MNRNDKEPCSYCGSDRHGLEDCAAASRAARRYASDPCAYCHSAGHPTALCPHPPSRRRHNESVNLFCTYCHSGEHNADFCPALDRHGQDPRVRNGEVSR